IHYMEVNTLPFSETPATWITNEIPQPVGALKAVYNGQGKNTVIEYMPSSWPWQFSTNYPGLPITHRYLPFNRYLAHKIYETDYAAGTDTSYEAQRNPGMRWTTYQYYGGNLFFKQGSYLNTPVVDETDISTLPFTEFNGFQKIIKTVHKFPGETWDNFETTTLFQQAIGDTNPVEASDETYFEQQPYGHFYFSGKIHSRRTESDSGFSQEENYTYDINWTAWNDEFDCLNDAACEPRLIYHEKEVKDSPAAVSRFHSVDYEHDDWGNVTHRTIKDGTNATLIEEDIDYYDVTNFDSNIQLRSRPQYMTKELGSVLRQTEYIYDNNGNPLQDAQLVSGSSYEYITRTFDNYGNVETEMNIDNVTTQFAYDTEHTYPTEATVNLPTGGTYTITRDYNYLNGAVISEINEHAVGQNIDYDDFGRPVTEYIVDAAGNQTITKEYEYSFETATIDGWPDQTLIKTQIYEPKTGYADTETTPSVITYSDANGFTLQECYYTERQDYRLAQMRKYDLGQIEVATEPQFANDCTFISSITTSRLYTTQKDFLGREIYVESPTGDANSPVGFVNISYDTDASGNLIKTSTTSAGDTTIEKFDAQNRLVEITNPQNTTLSYVYNAIGDLEEVWSNGIKLTEIEYDKLGRKTQMYDANLGTWSYEYNSNNKLYKQTDNKGQYIIHQYDSLARLSDKSTYDAGGSLEKQEVYTYDTGDMAHDVSRGELYTVEEFDGSGTLLRTTRFGYDSDYRRVGKITRTIEGVGDFEQDITYNDRGDVTSNTLPGGLSLNYTYNRTGQIEALCETADCNAASGEVYYYLNPANAFDAFGAVLREEYGNGVVVENDYYSNSHRLQNRKVYKGSAVYSERNYTYDVYSNITSLGDAQNQTGANAYNNIVYDSLNRLTDFTHTTTGTATSLQYDSFGNITQNSTYGADPYQYTSAKPHAVTQIGSDTFTYDDNGNMVRDPNRQMVYNAQNQLTQVTMTNGTVANYEYDYTGARVKKHTSHPTIYMTTEESTTHYLGDAVEVRGDKIHINIFAGGKKVATRCLGEVNEIMGWAASSLRPVNLKPQNRLAAYIPYFMLLFVLGIFLLFRPVPKLSFNARRRIP
ncbi:hypothetical protein KKF63_05540, partial [bacterium]|nr:hypothetical protein [bacterium]